MTSKRPDAVGLPSELIERELTGRIIQCFFAVHNTLGFGMLESVYRHALAVELSHHGLGVRQEVPIDVIYRNVEVGHFRWTSSWRTRSQSR